MWAVVRTTRERRAAENPVESRERRSTNRQITEMLINCLMPYQDQRMILIHQIIAKTLNRRSDSPTREEIVKPVESYWDLVPDQAIKKSNGPLSIQLSIESGSNRGRELTGELEDDQKGQQR